jgi:hypothetical protein
MTFETLKCRYCEITFVTLKERAEHEACHVPCKHDRLNEDGICRKCGTDQRGIQ